MDACLIAAGQAVGGINQSAADAAHPEEDDAEEEPALLRRAPWC